MDANTPVNANTIVVYRDLPKFGIPKLSRNTLNSMIDRGVFPPSVRYAQGSHGWRLGDLQTFLRELPPIGRDLPVLWTPSAELSERGRGLRRWNKPVGRRPGAKIVRDADGRRRVVYPAEGSNAA